MFHKIMRILFKVLLHEIVHFAVEDWTDLIKLVQKEKNHIKFQ